ncbi:MAG: hypothetical protein ACYCO0_00780 [Candidatus Micrarchaeaceae archaeon]
MAEDKKGLQPLEEDTWEDENYINHATVYKQGKVEGIAVKTAKKYSKGRPQWRQSFWLQKDQDVEGILEWLFGSVKRLFSKFWGREIISPTEIEANKKLVEELRGRLKVREGELDELMERYNIQQNELALAREVTGQFENYEKILNAFEEKIKTSVKNNERIEEWVKTEIKTNRWLMGLDCEVKAKNKDVDTQTEIDLHIETNFGEERLIEAKSPNLAIFDSKDEKRYNISSELARGLSELIEYMQRTQAYSLIKQRGVYAIDKPIGRILAGYELNEAQERLLNDWNFYLGPAIKIITFKELIKNARKEIELIKVAEKGKLQEEAEKAKG